jgi:prefoldin subunit 5
MITSVVEYEKAEEELRDLEKRLQSLQESNPIGSKGFTKAGIRKMIARIHEELAVYEASEEARRPQPR